MILGLGGLPEDDLVYVIDTVQDQVGPLANARVLVTGATGFVGRWLVASLVQARTQLDLAGPAIQVLVRDAESAQSRLGMDLWTAVDVVEGDVNSHWSLPEPVTHVIHGATPSSKRSGSDDAKSVLMTSVLGTRNLLRALGQHQVTPRVLHLSSGAVYGPQPLDLPRIPEVWTGGPTPFAQTAPYAEGKRAAEALLEAAAREGAISAVHARLFAFMGPGLPTTETFAIGNFISDAVEHRPVKVLGDGAAIRSYLDARELAAWLIQLLVLGQSGTPYNVGSPTGFTLWEWAKRCAALGKVQAQRRSEPMGERPVYVPDIVNSATLGIVPSPRDPDSSLSSWMQWLRRTHL